MKGLVRGRRPRPRQAPRGCTDVYVSGGGEGGGSRRPLAAFHVPTAGVGAVGQGVVAHFVPIDSVATAHAEVVHEAVFHVGLESPAPTLLVVHAKSRRKSSAPPRTPFLATVASRPLRGGSRAPPAARVRVGAMVRPLSLFWANSWWRLTRIEGYQTARVCV